MLLIENCIVHGRSDKLPYLNLMELVFLSPNAFINFQPMDVGSIDATNMRCRKPRRERIFDFMDENVASIDRVHQLTARRWLNICGKY